MVQLQNVTRTFPQNGSLVRALDGVSLQVGAGEFVALTGPSGSGKSTCLLTIGGLMRPTDGSVTVAAEPLYELNQTQRAELRLDRIGFVFQTFNLMPYLTALQNTMIPLCLKGRPGREQRERAESLLVELGMGDRLKHRPAELSVGERQRVALARALINDPELLLTDEPTGNLDPARSEEVLDRFSALNARGLTILMVTHDDRAADRAPRRLQLERGRLHEDAPVFDLHCEPWTGVVRRRKE